MLIIARKPEPSLLRSRRKLREQLQEFRSLEGAPPFEGLGGHLGVGVPGSLEQGRKPQVVRHQVRQVGVHCGGQLQGGVREEDCVVVAIQLR